MVDISFLEQYFPETNVPILIDPFTFRIILSQENNSTFIINLKIQQKDIPGEHLVKFRFGMGQHDAKENSSHESDKAHFEIETYTRAEETTSTTIYFTFQEPEDEHIINYTKGTVVLIEKILRSFFVNKKLNITLLEKLIYSDAIHEDLNGFDKELITALVKCFQDGELILRDGQGTVIRTPYKLEQCLLAPELGPLRVPLLEELKKKS